MTMLALKIPKVRKKSNRKWHQTVIWAQEEVVPVYSARVYQIDKSYSLSVAAPGNPRVGALNLK